MKLPIKNIVFALTIVVVAGLVLSASGCAYHVGYTRRGLAGGYDRLAIPVFKNKSMETGIEVYFSNSIIKEFSKSRVAGVISKSAAPVVLYGEIRKVEYISQTPGVVRLDATNPSRTAPLSGTIRIKVQASLRLERISDGLVIWNGDFIGEKIYGAPKLESSEINSANALYDHSEKHRKIKVIAQEMMLEAHDRMTENF